MDIEKKLLSEHSKSVANAIIKYVGSDKNRFNELFEIFMKGEYHLTQRAAWPLSYVLIANQQWMNGCMAALVKKLKQPHNHPAITRNILRILQEVEIPEKYQGEIVDFCLRIIPSEMHPAAIRAFAITTAANICQHYPELKKELLLLLQGLMQVPQSPAIKVRVRDSIKVLEKQVF